MNRKQRNWRTGSVFFGVLAGIILIWFLLPREMNLLKRSRLLEPNEDLVLPSASRLRMSQAVVRIEWPYCWIGPHQILSLHSIHGSVTPLSDWVTYIRDTNSGKETACPVMNSYLGASQLVYRLRIGGSASNAAMTVPAHSLKAVTTTRMLASPDNQWTLWTYSLDCASAKYPLVLTSAPNLEYLFSSDCQHCWKNDTTEFANSSCTWKRDNSGWIKFGEYWGTDALAPSSLLEIHPRTESQYFTVPVNLPISMALIGTTQAEQVVAVDWQTPQNGSVSAAQFAPDTRPVTPRRYTIPIPPDGRAVPLDAPLISPKGDRIAWIVSAPMAPPGWPITRRFWSLWKIAPGTVIGLWTTRLDGSDPREVGHLTQTDPDDNPTMLQWTPDSKSLSFRYLGSLYSVPAQ